jgi:hypothetical protein
MKATCSTASLLYQSFNDMLEAQALDEDGKDDDHVGHSQHDLALAACGQGQRQRVKPIASARVSITPIVAGSLKKRKFR